MSEKHLEVVEAEFGMGPDCPTCKAKVTPQIAMDEHAPLCAQLVAKDMLLAEAKRALEYAHKFHDCTCENKDAHRCLVGGALARIEKGETKP